MEEDYMTRVDVAEQIESCLQHIGLTVARQGRFVMVYFENTEQMFAVTVRQVP